ELLTKLVEVTGHRLSDRKAAAVYARKAYDLVPGSETALDLLETATRAAGSWETFVQALEGRLAALAHVPAQAAAPAPAAGGGKRGKRRKKAAQEEPSSTESAAESSEGERRHLELKLARVYSEELGRSEDAILHYKRWLERDPGDFDAAQALEAILRREDRRDDLRWLLELRVDNAQNPEERVRLVSEWAALEEDVFDAPEHAARLYQRVLEIDASDENALSALPRLLLGAQDAQGAARVIEQHRDQLEGEERAEREIELAELYLSRLERPKDALSSAINALGVKPADPRAMGVLERLLEYPELRSRAARTLAEQYATGGEARREAQALTVMLEQAGEREQRRELYARLADVHEQKLGASGTALEVVLRALGEYPDELSLWDRAEGLAAAAGRPTDLAEAFRDALRQELPKSLEADLCERAAQLHDDRLGDPLGAAPYLERVLTLDPSNERAFLRLKDILTAAERWGELEALYDRASNATDDPDRRIEMLVEVALICEEIIEDPDKATRYYERILKSDPLHDSAVRALDRLYAAQGRHRDLAHLLERRVAISEGGELLDLKLRLARIQLERLHEPDKAISHVEDVLNERQNDYQARELAERLLDIGSLRVRAACMLEGVYEGRSEIRDLVRVLSIRLEDLGVGERAPQDAEGERKELLRRIATLRDERLHEDEGALDALAELVPLEPLDVDSRNRMVAIGRRVGAHQRVAEVLARAAERADTPVLKGEILMLVAGTFEEHLNDPEKAEHTYRRVLMLDETDAELALPAARALERIYVQSGQHHKLADILRVQVRLEQDTEARRGLLGRLGELCQGVLQDTQGAIVAWRARADENPGDERALAALDELYERSERWRDLVTVIEKRRELATDGKTRRPLMVRAAQILSNRLGTSSEAIEAWRALLDEYGPDEEVLTALEQLYLAAERWDELGETYERHLDIASS
ncbi:MAG TPA: hypothetical protein VK524_20775, partial [Polyangiaceae bacterium]|nr:hypothetical protein [Polyangiaceae bacterium]